MDSVLIIRDRKGDCRIPLLSKDAALARLPSLAEVFEVLADLNLDGQCKGLASLLMQQPGIHVALGRFMGLLDLFVSTERSLERASEDISHEQYLLAQEREKVALLLTTTATLQSELKCKEEQLAWSTATVQDLERELEASRQENMPPIDLGFLDDGPPSGQAADAAKHALRNARETAAAAQRQRDLLEARMMEQEDVHQNQIAWMSAETERAQAALAATIEHANTQVQRNQQLQQQLRLTEDSRDSLSAALVSEQAARTEAEQRLVETERTTGDRITMLTTLTAQQSRAIEAAKVEGATLRSRVTALEEHKRRNSAAAEPPAPASSFNAEPNHADPAAAASPAGGSASAGTPLQTASQEERQSPVIVTSGIAVNSTSTPAPDTTASLTNTAATSLQTSYKKPRGLLGAAFFGAGVAAGLVEVAFKIGKAAVKHLLTSAVRTLITSF